MIVFDEGEVVALKNLIVSIVSFAVFDGIGLAMAFLGTAAKTIASGFKRTGDAARKALDRAVDSATRKRASTTRGPLCRKRCFPAGTPIRVAEGTRPIETVRAGDLVWACDPEAEVWSLKEVVENYVIDYEALEERGEWIPCPCGS